MIKLMVILHILMGSIAILGMITAWVTKKGGLWHRRGGKTYVFGMTGALILAFIVSIATKNIFLFFVGLFSAYFIYTGFRVAIARDSIRSKQDKMVTTFLVLVGLTMLVYSVFIFNTENSEAIVLTVFGLLAITQGYVDIRHGDKWPAGKERIALHLNRMGAANIATVTAIFVVNVQTNPSWIAWLIPSVIGSFIISYWTRKTLAPGVISNN